MVSCVQGCKVMKIPSRKPGSSEQTALAVANQSTLLYDLGEDAAQVSHFVLTSGLLAGEWMTHHGFCSISHHFPSNVARSLTLWRTTTLRRR